MPNYKEYQLVCQHCGKVFIGSHPWTRYCSATCGHRAIKQNMKRLRIEEDSAAVKERARSLLASKEFVSISDAARLLDVSRPTVYKIIRDNEIEVLHFGARTLRIRIADLVDTRNTYSPLNTPFPEIQKMKSGYVTISDAAKIFNMSKEQIYSRLKDTPIQSIRYKGQACYKQSELEQILLPHQHEDLDAWYTVDEIVEKFKITKQHVYDQVSKLQLPKKRDGVHILISKFDWDATRDVTDFDLEQFYTAPQIIAKYGVKRDLVDNAVKARKITSILKGKTRLYEKAGIDTYFIQRKQNKLCQPQK